MKNATSNNHFDVRNHKKMMLVLIALAGGLCVLFAGCSEGRDGPTMDGWTAVERQQYASESRELSKGTRIPASPGISPGQRPLNEQLMYAIQNQDREFVIKAIQKGVPLDQRYIGLRAVNLAAAYSTDEILSYVLAAGGVEFVNVYNGSHERTLDLALRYNHRPKVVERLIRAGGTSHQGDAMLIAARHQRNPDVLEVLVLELGADLKAKTKTGKTLLMTAASQNQNLKICRYLIKEGVEVNAVDERGMTALMFASRSNPNAAVCAELIRAGADIHAADGSGKTALMHAGSTYLSNGNPAAIRSLLAAGSDPDAKSHQGMTALDYAMANKKSNEQAISLLRAAK